MEAEYIHAQVRRVEKLDVPTPLIVPSFSSRGFPNLTDIWEEFSTKLYGVCLVSAFDVAQGSIPKDVTDLVNVVIWDSGSFETSSGHTELDGRRATSTPVEWTRNQYQETLENIGAGTNAIVVNFDEIDTLEDQISRASEDFSLVPHAASNFLVKPAGELEWVNLPKLGLHLDKLAQMSVVGIAAREAGDSLFTRCCSIVMLRDMLHEAGLDTPIHVFGAINPYEVLAYFFCGADIFDGLNWFRCLFRSSGSIPIGDSATEDFRWNLTDSELQMEAWTKNLRFLFQLQEGMQRFGAGGGLESLLEEFPMARKTARVAHIAGAEIRK